MSTPVQTLLAKTASLERAGRISEAIEAYQQLLLHTPGLPDSWYNLALLQKRMGAFDAALGSYQEALNRGISQPEEVHLNRAVIFSDCLRQEAAAESALRNALELNPRYLPALLNLANLYEDLARRDEALAQYEALLAIAPKHYEALARYVSLRGVTGADDPLVKRLKSAIADPAANAMDQASLGFALGKVLDACGEFDQAFAAYVHANQSSRAGARMGAGRSPYDRQGHERFVDQLMQAFALPAAHPATPAPDSSPCPIFICGMFRSGSTLAEQVLAGHSRMRAGGEIDFIPALVRNELAPFPASMAQLSAPNLEKYALLYRNRLSTMFPGAAHITDKRPDNFLYIGLIKRLFPNAKIIHTTRNALDNCLSIYFLHLGHGMGYALDLLDTGHYYKQYQRLMAHWKLLYGDDILTLDYDTLVHEPRPAIESLLDFVGLDWDENCLHFQHVKNAVKTASVWQVREGLYQRSSGRWRNYAQQLEPLREYLATSA
ncbi:MAG: sulfotransferase [Rhodocyclaceae bacterium]|nr:sulfotransferase [Rhodocyclaceae bacterium]MCA3052229.1 sulfotransferase [Rhodocyclaceae bacterium]